MMMLMLMPLPLVMIVGALITKKVKSNLSKWKVTKPKNSFVRLRALRVCVFTAQVLSDN